MASNYRKVHLGDICHIKNGYAFKSKDFSEKGIPVIKIKNVKPNRIVLDGFSYIPQEIAILKSNYLIRKGEILLTMTGNRIDGSPESWVGKAAYFDLDGDYLLNQRVAAITAGENIDPVFLGYYLSSWDSQMYFIQRSNSSGGQANISPDIVKSMEVMLPDYATQKKIAKVLKSFDKKIAVCNAINENLAQQAQAVYADIFISNVDPTWPLGHLSDLITVRYGKDHKKLGDGPFPVYGSGGIMRYVERPIYEKESVLIPRKGTLNNVMYVNEPFWSVDTMFFTEMKLPDVAKFVFHFVKSKDLASLNAGSAVPSMTTDILNAMELYIPDAETRKRFEIIVGPMYRDIQHNTEESKKLVAVRDSLLPQLMSGELDVSGIEL